MVQMVEKYVEKVMEQFNKLQRNTDTEQVYAKLHSITSQNTCNIINYVNSKEMNMRKEALGAVQLA
jgi:hypothetical protein